jgi:hypothetical protein
VLVRSSTAPRQIMPQPLTAPRLRAGVVSSGYTVIGQDCLTAHIIYNIKCQRWILKLIRQYANDVDVHRRRYATSFPDQAFPSRQFTVGAEQMRQSPAMRFQSGEKFRLAFRPRHQAGQPASIAGREIPGVIFAQ